MVVIVDSLVGKGNRCEGTSGGGVIERGMGDDERGSCSVGLGAWRHEVWV